MFFVYILLDSCLNLYSYLPITHPTMDATNGNRRQQRVNKCHGNRRNQRFRRKCRAQGMKAAKIEKLLQHRNKNVNTTDRSTTNTVNRRPTEVATRFSKRKRDISVQDFNSSTSAIPKSTSSISILQPSLKKAKTIQTSTKTSKRQKKKKKQIFNLPLKQIRASLIIETYRSAAFVPLLTKAIHYFCLDDPCI